MAESGRMTQEKSLENIRKSGESAYFPLFMNIEQKKFLVFGAGAIAARRLEGLLRFGASAAVIAPQIHEDIKKLPTRYPERLLIEQRPYLSGEISRERADYVLAAADNAVNDAVAAECRSKAIPVNHASDRRQCDFYFPALAECNGLVIGITSTDGSHKKTARVSALLRDALCGWCGTDS